MVEIAIYTDELLEKELLQIVDELKRKHIELGQRATGNWVNSLEVVVSNGKGIIYGTDYTQYIVKGRPPNNDKSHEALRTFAGGMVYKNEHFQEWLKIRGQEEHGFAIAYKIGKEGTKSYSSGGTDLIDSVITDQRIKEIYQNIGSKLRVKIAENLRR